MKVAIFDLDGTLFDTSDVNYHAYKFALEKYGKNLEYEYYCKECNGRHYKTYLPEIVDYDSEKVEDIHNIKKEVYSKYLDKVKININLFEIIKSIKDKYKIVLVTTASKKNTIEILEYTKTKEYFDDIITGNDVKKVKPDPEGFLIAMNKYNAKPEECIIFEDSDIGIQAGIKTGACVFKVEKF